MQGESPKKKPKLKEFQELSKKFSGNKSSIAESLGVCYNTLDKWCKEVPEFQESISHQTEKRLDGYLDVAHLLAMGIPEKENGKIVGWKVVPDAATLRFMIEKYGVRRGLGDKLDITTNGNDISSGLKIEIIDKREDVKIDTEE